MLRIVISSIIYIYVSIDYLFLFNLCMELFIIVRMLKHSRRRKDLAVTLFLFFSKVVIVRVSKVTYNDL